MGVSKGYEIRCNLHFRAIIMNIRKELEHQLVKPNHIVKIQDLDTGNRLEKDVKNMRFAFSMGDINEEFGGIDELIEELKNRNFGNTQFLFQKYYGTPDKATYHMMKEVTTDLGQYNTVASLTTQENATVTQTTPPPNSIPNGIDFLGGANLAGANPIQYLGALVEAQRAGDFRNRIVELEDSLRDVKSKNRRLEEENHALKLKVETVEEKADLKVQRKLLDKESILEKAGTQKFLESIGGMLPHFVNMMSKGSTTALNAPALTPIQQQAFDLIKQADEEQISLVIYLLANYNEELVSLIGNYIQKNTP